jgi:hypothetical protein
MGGVDSKKEKEDGKGTVVEKMKGKYMEGE